MINYAYHIERKKLIRRAYILVIVVCKTAEALKINEMCGLLKLLKMHSISLVLYRTMSELCGLLM